jgi:hypothetical protein
MADVDAASTDWPDAAFTDSPDAEDDNRPYPTWTEEDILAARAAVVNARRASVKRLLDSYSDEQQDHIMSQAEALVDVRRSYTRLMHLLTPNRSITGR